MKRQRLELAKAAAGKDGAIDLNFASGRSPFIVSALIPRKVHEEAKKREARAPASGEGKS